MEKSDTNLGEVLVNSMGEQVSQALSDTEKIERIQYHLQR